ncbi:MAG: glycoside hydrolase family 2 protein [Clostridia bacterium]
MTKISLNGTWKMKRTDWQDWMKATVPGSVYCDLLANQKMDDPFYRDNEDKSLKLMEYDYQYEKEFSVDSELLTHDEIQLQFEGLDTLARVTLNGKLLATTDNMHRTYNFDAKPLLQPGTNQLNVTFFSPTKYIAEKYAAQRIWGANAMKGFPYLRKAHYMFGWDWGPELPDMGIWRDVAIVAQSGAKLDDVKIHQEHDLESGGVTLTIDLSVQQFSPSDLTAECTLFAPSGETQSTHTAILAGVATLSFQVQNPALWWPNGYGAQPLYTLEVKLLCGERCGTVAIDTRSFQIGLKQFKVLREADEWGESFTFNINGLSIFARGANYIPEDNLLPRCSREKTEKLIQHCVNSNFNCIRVWGGGIYPPDYFFDLCDQYGLIVWQDFMFACAVYDLTQEFEENIRAEFVDNIKRIRHHACLGLWCGNNENEQAIQSWHVDSHSDNPAQRNAEYLKMFEEIIPAVLHEHDPDTFYWPSSPSSGGKFDDPNDFTRGDAHYWGVWIGLEPITEYRKQCFRFMSEFGFISFPCLKTIESFTLPEDRNPFSYVMDKHQKHPGGNGKVMHYLSEEYRYPESFESFLFSSQILQAEAIKYGVENWRKQRGKCMGTIFWQVNDCNPVVSWSSIDYFGRWKALQYYVKKMFAPILLVATDDDTRVAFDLVNDTTTEIAGTVHWSLRTNTAEILQKGSFEAACAPMSAHFCTTLDFTDALAVGETRRSTYLEYSFVVDDEILMKDTVLFVKPKHFVFLKPTLTLYVTETDEEFWVFIETDVFAKNVALEIEGADCVFSDNYFDLSDSKTVTVKKSELPAQVLKEGIKVRVNSIVCLTPFQQILSQS